VSGVHAPVARSEAVERCVVWIEAHVGRLAERHDPWGHLFAIERLARAARAEWWEAHREPERERRRR
jgi:hypothetical protein